MKFSRFTKRAIAVTALAAFGSCAINFAPSSAAPPDLLCLGNAPEPIGGNGWFPAGSGAANITKDRDTCGIHKNHGRVDYVGVPGPRAPHGWISPAVLEWWHPVEECAPSVPTKAPHPGLALVVTFRSLIPGYGCSITGDEFVVWDGRGNKRFEGQFTYRERGLHGDAPYGTFAQVTNYNLGTPRAYAEVRFGN